MSCLASRNYMHGIIQHKRLKENVGKYFFIILCQAGWAQRPCVAKPQGMLGSPGRRASTPVVSCQGPKSRSFCNGAPYFLVCLPPGRASRCIPLCLLCLLSTWELSLLYTSTPARSPRGLLCCPLPGLLFRGCFGLSPPVPISQEASLLHCGF